MGRGKLAVFLGGTVVILIGLCWFLYSIGGLKYYLKAKILFTRYPKLIKQFNAPSSPITTTSNYYYMGILAGTWKGGIWLWGDGGLKYFSDAITTTLDSYITLKMCNKDNRLQKEKYTTLREWTNNMNVGDYVWVVYDKGKFVDKIRRIRGYDHWVFLNKSIITECEVLSNLRK